MEHVDDDYFQLRARKAARMTALRVDAFVVAENDPTHPRNWKLVTSPGGMNFTSLVNKSASGVLAAGLSSRSAPVVPP
jgi:hypothetical protein